ncbi:hypothetical protein NQ038_04815 [Brevibacterium sp. 50QC2O2]|uniref:hypothetical protein n=1 Tax=Brevibacterium TaxID=1696 RepID=UPI00211C7997|nr:MULTISPECIES: hypothetical protein [unclassified Brevibacterium]MCQ9367709.1 hypothetical protein [Brevibacterium sp. 91QC2O2]MCQ9384985.1 hypothetical protein [Brevibacterium sp. 68QC2CO]MCQ9387968.1 hypothetical protein [Brevibacterium sp. 50QC2O2]
MATRAHRGAELGYRVYLLLMLVAVVGAPSYLGMLGLVRARLAVLAGLAQLSEPLAPALLAGCAALGLSLATRGGLQAPGAFRLATLLDSPRARSSWLLPRLLWPVAGVAALTCLLCSIPAAAGAGAWWTAWALLLISGTTLASLVCAAGVLVARRTLLSALGAAWALTAVLTAVALSGGFASARFGAASGFAAALGWAWAGPVVFASTVACALGCVLAAGALVGALRHLDESALLERCGAASAWRGAMLTGDPVAASLACAEAPVHLARLPRDGRGGRRNTAHRSTAFALLRAALPRVRATGLGALRRPQSLLLAGVAALGAGLALGTTGLVDERLLWLPLSCFVFLASWARAPFDAALSAAARVQESDLSGLPPALEFTAVLAVPFLLLALLTLLGTWAPAIVGLIPGSGALLPRAILMVPALVGLRVRGLLAPPLPLSRLASIPTAFGDMQGLRVLSWVLDGPLRLGLLAACAALAWSHPLILAALAAALAYYAWFGVHRRVRSA